MRHSFVHPARTVEGPPPAKAPRHGLRWMAWWLAVLMVFRPHELIPQLSVVRPVILTSILAIGVLLVQARWERILAQPQTRWIAAYFAWALMTMPFALHRSGTVPILQKMLVFVLLAALVASFPPGIGALRSLIDRMLVAFVGFAVIVLVVGKQSTEVGRIQGVTSYDPNELAALAVTFFGLALGTFRSPRWGMRLVGLASVLLSLILVVRSGSRGGAIAAIVALAATLILLRGRWRILAIASISVFALLAMSTPTFRQRVVSIGSVSDDYNVTSYNGRVEIWKRGLGYLVEHPVTGVGVNNFTEMEGRIRSETLVRGIWLNAHNMFVQVGAELGFLGLGIFLAMIWTAWRGALANWRARASRLAMPEVLIALIGIVISGFFLSFAYSELLIFTLVVSAAAGTEWKAGSRAATPRAPASGARGRRGGSAFNPRLNVPMAFRHTSG